MCWVVAAATAASVWVWGAVPLLQPMSGTAGVSLPLRASSLALPVAAYLAPEAELPDTLGLVVIPYHDLCTRAGRDSM